MLLGSTFQDKKLAFRIPLRWNSREKLKGRMTCLCFRTLAWFRGSRCCSPHSGLCEVYDRIGDDKVIATYRCSTIATALQGLSTTLPHLLYINIQNGLVCKSRELPVYPVAFVLSFSSSLIHAIRTGSGISWLRLVSSIRDRSDRVMLI